MLFQAHTEWLGTLVSALAQSAALPGRAAVWRETSARHRPVLASEQPPPPPQPPLAPAPPPVPPAAGSGFGGVPQLLWLRGLQERGQCRCAPADAADGPTAVEKHNAAVRSLSFCEARVPSCRFRRISSNRVRSHITCPWLVSVDADTGGADRRRRVPAPLPRRDGRFAIVVCVRRCASAAAAAGAARAQPVRRARARGGCGGGDDAGRPAVRLARAATSVLRFASLRFDFAALPRSAVSERRTAARCSLVQPSASHRKSNL